MRNIIQRWEKRPNGETNWHEGRKRTEGKQKEIGREMSEEKNE